MARELMLLDRLRECGEQTRTRFQPSANEDLDALMGSVRRNLARLLNSRHGCCEALPDYGLPALADMTLGGGDHVRRMLDAVRTAVEKYEPRLARISVTRVVDEDSKQTLSFRVDGMLMAQDGQHRVCYETNVGGDGQFDVSD